MSLSRRVVLALGCLLVAGLVQSEPLDPLGERELAEKNLLDALNDQLQWLIGGSEKDTGADRAPLSKPNILLLVGDDMGYNDLSSYGNPSQESGFIDDLAAGGKRFIQGYVADSVCTPSRSAFMTGRLPVRIGTYGHTRVFLPWTTTGLPKDELTIAEVLKEAGYATGMVGKWHLGINKETNSDGAHLPYNHGFDYVGHNLPFTNSIACDDTGLHRDFPRTETCYLYKNATLLSQPFSHNGLTGLFTNDAIEFVNDNKAEPFFLYVAYAHLHSSLFSSAEFECSSKRGRYGDNLNEMHDSVKQIVNTLVKNEIDDNTIIFFISDHGPHREACEEGGDAGVFRGGKSNSWEGGQRIPYIVYWPGVIEPGVNEELVTSMDIIATAADLAGVELPTDRIYDGKSIKEVLFDGAASPHESFLYYCKDVIMGARVGDFKAHFFTQKILGQEGYGEVCYDGFPVNDYFLCNECDGDCVTAHNPPLLFNIRKDPSEAYPLSPLRYARQLKLIQDAVKEHQANLVKGEPILNSLDLTKSIVPCCNQETNCICNYEQKPGIAACYNDTQSIADAIFFKP